MAVIANGLDPALSHQEDEIKVSVPQHFVERSSHALANFDEYKTMYQSSIDDPQAFWAKIAEEFHWETRWDPNKVLDYNFNVEKGPIFTHWFRGAKTNLAYNCLDRIIQSDPTAANRVALYFEPNDLEDGSQSITYGELLAMVSRMGNVLRKQGVKPGDKVAIYMPMIPELPAIMLACARIGAVHSVVFGGFSAEALAGRIVDSKANVLVSCDGVMRGKKLVTLKAIGDEALEIAASRNHTVNAQLVYQRLGQARCAVEMASGRDIWLHEAMGAVDETCPVHWSDAEDPLFILYTSGSTGTPKGIVHSTAGYMIYAATTFKYSFDYQPGDVFFCTADCGWITGHTYVAYGPLLNGASQVVFEGVPSFPDAGRLWDITDKFNVAQLYTAPTAIRALKRFGDEFVSKYKRSSLKVLGTVGEPINPEAWEWYYNVVGDSRCPIADTWWQTETGGHVITPLPVAGLEMKPGAASFPFFGCEPAILNQDGQEIEGPGSGYLVIKKPWPSVLRTIQGDHARMESVYFSQFPGYYTTGDGCRRDADGYIWITGRVDDVLNVSGHRIGTAEVESALVRHPKVVEAAVVGVPHDIKGEGIYAYVTLMAGEEPDDEIRKELIAVARKEIGPIATPDALHWAPALPKTRSGKIMRRILRKIAANGKEVDVADLGDTSTLADPSVVGNLIDSYGQ